MSNGSKINRSSGSPLSDNKSSLTANGSAKKLTDRSSAQQSERYDGQGRLTF